MISGRWQDVLIASRRLRRLVKIHVFARYFKVRAIKDDMARRNCLEL